MTGGGRRGRYFIIKTTRWKWEYEKLSRRRVIEQRANKLDSVVWMNDICQYTQQMFLRCEQLSSPERIQIWNINSFNFAFFLCSAHIRICWMCVFWPFSILIYGILYLFMTLARWLTGALAVILPSFFRMSYVFCKCRVLVAAINLIKIWWTSNFYFTFSVVWRKFRLNARNETTIEMRWERVEN